MGLRKLLLEELFQRVCYVILECLVGLEEGRALLCKFLMNSKLVHLHQHGNQGQNWMKVWKSQNLLFRVCIKKKGRRKTKIAKSSKVQRGKRGKRCLDSNRSILTRSAHMLKVSYCSYVDVATQNS